MRVLFCLNHPAHFHLCKNLIDNLKKKGNEVFIIAREKDVLIDLLKGYEYYLIPVVKGQTLSQKFKLLFKSNKYLLDYIDKVKPDFVTGTGLFCDATKKRNIPSYLMAEDDVTTNFPIFLTGVLYYGAYSGLVSPSVCNNSLWNRKTVKYSGFQKLAYLHPNWFKTDTGIVNTYFPSDKKYFILRFAKLNAYHDINAKGITTEIAQKLIDLLSRYGNVYITSERELEPQFEKYRLNINPLHIHHILSCATLMIGDSQSMAVEAAMLGTPSVRFNDFAGKIGVLEELEHKYGLTYGIKTSQPEQLFAKVEELVATPNLKDEFQKRREHMLSDKIDVTAFFTWFIENYPESKRIMKENPDYQYRFK